MQAVAMERGRRKLPLHAYLIKRTNQLWNMKVVLLLIPTVIPYNHTHHMHYKHYHNQDEDSIKVWYIKSADSLHVHSTLMLSLLSLGKGCTCKVILHRDTTPCTPTIPSDWSPTKGVYYTEWLTVFIKLLDIGVVTGATTLPLTAKIIFKRILADVHT